MQVVELRNVEYGDSDTLLFSNISFRLELGEALVITGPSGCGKSILLEICAGMRKPTSGSVLWDDVDVAKIPRPILMKMRTKIGFVFQQNALISNYSVFNNIALPLQYHLHPNVSELNSRVFDMLKKFDLWDVKDNLPESLSAGQAKKVALARALIMEPNFLFFDELTSGLDQNSIEIILGIIEKIRMRKKVAILLMSHNSLIALQLQCPFAMLKAGELLWHEHSKSHKRETI